MSGVAFYCVTGRDFFPGAVALVNSLRLNGHFDPIRVLDCGMDPEQRDQLASQATILPAPSDAPPSMLKLVAPQALPADVMFLLDADIIVTRPLDDLITEAARGRLVAFENESSRFFPQWGEMLGLGPVRRGRYVMSSAIGLDRQLGRQILPLVEAKQLEVDTDRTWLAGSRDEAAPFFYADQDVLNAVIAARLGTDRVFALDSRLAAVPPFEGLRIVDARAARCAYPDGSEPYLLHHYFRKPWLVRMRSNVYSRLLTRLLLANDVALRLDPAAVPPRLRTGPAAALVRAAVDVVVGGPAALRRRLAGRPRVIEAWPSS
jgi:hypothetical protein